MFELSFEVNGKKVALDEIGDRLKSEIEKEAAKSVFDQLSEKVSNIVCPEHGFNAKIIASATSFNSISDLNLKVSGCCQKLIDKVTFELEKD